MSEKPAELKVRLYADDVLVAETSDEQVFSAVMSHIHGPEKQNAEELRQLGTFTTALRLSGL